MTVKIDAKRVEDEAWLTEEVNKILKKCYLRGVSDDVIVTVFGEMLQASQVSAELVLASLKELTAPDEDEDDGSAAYA